MNKYLFCCLVLCTTYLASGRLLLRSLGTIGFEPFVASRSLGTIGFRDVTETNASQNVLCRFSAQLEKRLKL